MKLDTTAAATRCHQTPDLPRIVRPKSSRVKTLAGLVLGLAAITLSPSALGQASEGFTNLPTTSSSSYLSRSWTGDDNVTWTAEGARTDQTINDKAICFGNSGNRWVTSPVYSGGMGTLSFKYVRAFTGTSARSIEVWVNGSQIGSSITVSPTSDEVVNYSESINVSGSVQLVIKCTGAAQVKLDDISWTAYSGTGPAITSFTPTSGWSGTAVTITGLNFTGVTAVKFNGVDAGGFTVDSDAQISCTAPEAPTTGKISVTSPEGTGTSSLDFTADPPDTAGPVATAFLPANGATKVSVDEDLTVSFNENVVAGTGNILIKKASDHSVVATLDVTDAARVQAFYDMAYLNPEFPLPMGTELYVEIPAGAFLDGGDHPSLAIGGAGVWQFTTLAIPELTSSTAYTQDFSTFVSEATLPDGWEVTASGGSTSRYNYSAWNTTAAPNTNTGIKFSASDPVTNVFGYQHTTDTGTVVKKLTLINGTGEELNTLTIQYTGRQSRTDIGREASYAVSVNGGEAVAALAYNTGSGDNQIRNAVLSGLGIAAGEMFTIEWTCTRDATGSGNTRQIGISALSVSAGVASFPPTVAAMAVTNGSVTMTSAEVTANVIADGGQAITQRGFVYSVTSVNSAPELGGTGVIAVIDGTNDVGALAATLSGLADGTSYSVRAFATNSVATGYSSTVAFTTLLAPPVLVTSYSQPFNSFTGTLPNGWTSVSSGNVQSYIGVWSSTSASGGFYGGVSDPGVLGYQHTADTLVLTHTLTLRNQTGSTLTQLHVSYLGRVERTTNTRHPTWTVTVAGQEVPELAYSTAAGTDQTKSHLVTGLNVPAGETFTITWLCDRGTNATGSSRRIGIADVQVSLDGASGGGYADWAGANAGGQTADLDFDTDGMANGVEFFMDAAAGFTANPGVVAGKVSWPNGGNLSTADYGTKFIVQTSTNLSGWTDVLVTDPNLSNTAGALEYTLPAGETKIFVRLVVTP